MQCWGTGMGTWLPLTFLCSAVGRVMVHAEEWGEPQSRAHTSLFSFFTCLLGFILSHGFNHLQLLLHLTLCLLRHWPEESSSYVPELESWEWWSRETRDASGCLDPVVQRTPSGAS